MSGIDVFDIFEQPKQYYIGIDALTFLLQHVWVDAGPMEILRGAVGADRFEIMDAIKGGRGSFIWFIIIKPNYVDLHHIFAVGIAQNTTLLPRMRIFANIVNYLAEIQMLVQGLNSIYKFLLIPRHF